MEKGAMPSFREDIFPPGAAPARAPAVFVDVHCHCLPDMDDGPADQAEALTLCEALAADGVATVVATPHQLGRYDGLYRGTEIRQAVTQLNQLLTEARIPLTVVPGADVRIDERIGELLRSDDILTVGDAGRWLMLELPHEVFIDPAMLLATLAESSISVMVSHPERHRFLALRPSHVREWIPYCPCLQITAGSFLGEFGSRSERAAWAFLDEPLPLLVANDAHDTAGRAPRLTAAHALLTQRLGPRIAEILCLENPRRLLAGDDLLMLDP
jgi:protein-tyrosine phosphatase